MVRPGRRNVLGVVSESQVWCMIDLNVIATFCMQHWCYSALGYIGTCSAVDKPKFMGRPLDHSWWKTGSPISFFGCLNYFDLPWKKFVFFFHLLTQNLHVFRFIMFPPYRELGHPLGYFGGHVGSPNHMVGRIWRLGDHLSTARPGVGVTKAPFIHFPFWEILISRSIG